MRVELGVDRVPAGAVLRLWRERWESWLWPEACVSLSAPPLARDLGWCRQSSTGVGVDPLVGFEVSVQLHKTRRLTLDLGAQLMDEA